MLLRSLEIALSIIFGRFRPGGSRKGRRRHGPGRPAGRRRPRRRRAC